MNLKNKIRKPFVIVFMMIFMAACSDSFLDVKPAQSTLIEDTVKDMPTLRAAVFGIYSLTQSANYYGRTVPLVPELMSDNTFLSVVNSNRYRPMDQFITLSNDGNASGTWDVMYRIIANSNLLIQKGEPLKIPVATDTVEKNQIVGEAYALRALALFDLTRFFAQPYNSTADASHLGVALVDSTGTSKEVVISPARSSVKACYDRIIADFNKAITLLPATSVGFTNKSRITRMAAKALLARALLYKGDWAAAETQASDVIASTAPKFTLLPNATYVADFKKISNSETIFEVANNLTDNGGTDGLGYFYGQNGYGDCIATDTLYNLYRATDVRRSFMVKGRRNASGGEATANIVFKYDNATPAIIEENIKVIRLAEVYLIRAEARAQQTGKETTALADLNVLIARADPTATPLSGLAGTALLDAVLNERRKELAFEGHRAFDLNRFKKNFIKNRASNVRQTITYPNDKLIFPIPQRELDANSNMKQNPGYN